MSLPAGTYAPFKIKYLDAGNETSDFEGYGADLTAGNFAAQQTLFTALITAADALVLGVRLAEEYGNKVTHSGVPPINGAMRETKLLIQWQNISNGRRGVRTLPTLDPTIPDYVQNINAKDIVQTTSPPAIVDFIGAFEDFFVDPIDGGAVSVVGLQVVGRNT